MTVTSTPPGIPSAPRLADMLAAIHGTDVERADGTTSPGFLSRAEFAAGYARRTGRDISRIGYYVAFGYFKLAVVLEGIHARYLQHQTVGEGFEQEGLVVPALVARAHQVLDAD